MRRARRLSSAHFSPGFVQRESDVITPAEAALWKRGASNAGDHYLGCARTFALMGKALAEANLQMLPQPKSR